MATLTQLLAHHRRILVLDAASLRVQVGLLTAGSEPHWRASADDANRALFSGAEACLAAAGLEVAQVDAYVFCAGPGSMLGIRTAAMAIRTWQALARRPAYAYSSLGLLAAGLARRMAAPFTVIADARRDSWHAVSVTPDGPGPLRRAGRDEIAGGTGVLVQPTAFRAWAPPPRPASDAPYEVADLFQTERDLDLWTESDAPDGFQHEAPAYRKWQAQVHTAPAARA